MMIMTTRPMQKPDRMIMSVLLCLASKELFCLTCCCTIERVNIQFRGPFVPAKIKKPRWAKKMWLEALKFSAEMNPFISFILIEIPNLKWP